MLAIEEKMRESMVSITDDVSVVLCGSAGHGIQTVEQILTRILIRAGFNVFGTKEYMSRVRGGSNSTEIRVSSESRPSLLSRIDILVPFDGAALKHLKKRISQATLMLGEKDRITEENKENVPPIVDVPFTKIASDIGGAVYTNSVATGLIAGLFRISRENIDGFLKDFFSGAGDAIIEKNRDAAAKGYEIAGTLVESGNVSIEITKKPDVVENILINGAEAVGIGAIAGGCNFISSYPMSPSTGVLVFLSQHAGEFGIIAEQAEDEISAINMVLGAWYAGARAMVTTSGGGFALMEEGVSLAGMTETPAVIHLAQRPGPATGLPTRTEQGDLNLVLYSGHGVFPRIILAPGTLEDAVCLTRDAFTLADKYQVPVFILTDQYFIDSYYNIPTLTLENAAAASFISKTDNTYKRYEITKTGISPRGIPGFGGGLVAVDSDEHDEEGHITENLDIRVAMMDKRLRKLKEMKKDAFCPELTGTKDYKTLVIGWGSTCHVIREALSRLNKPNVSSLYFKQVYPLHPETEDYLKRAERVVVVEGNANAQFASLIRLETGYEIEDTILKYDGSQFSVEELEDRLEAILG
jgi:2-oxoglutarate ferredoxin oxidoreductase subunit alpha